MHRHLLIFFQKLFLTFILFLTLNLSAQTTISCSKYDIISTNNFCGCFSDQFRPYGLFIEANNSCGLVFFKPDTVIFEIRNDSTAAIKGVFRTFNDWRPVRVDITLQKAVSSTPRLDLCLTNSPTSVANQWRYFGAMSGTIQFDTDPPLSISSRGGNFQVGIGANGQNTDQFGGSGFFTLSNGEKGGFGFTLTNPSAGTCLLPNPCLRDTIPPILSVCPQNISLSTSGASVVATWIPPTATDNCGSPTITSNFLSGTTFGIGTTAVIYTARDAANNTAECRFNVVVTRLDPCTNDVIAPVFANCPQNISLTTSSTTAIATWTPPTATDNCTPPSVSSNFSSGAPFSVGTTQVIYMAADAANNTAECRFNVVITRLDPCTNDTMPPVFSNCPQNINLTTTGTSAVATWAAPTATDNCTTASISSNFVSGSAFAVGTSQVVYTAKDAANNKSECRFNVIVTSQTSGSGICTSYAVNNTNDICSCPTRQWTPYGLFIERDNSACGEYYQVDKVDFQINGDGSARLVGVFRTSAWRPVWLDIQWAQTAERTPRFSTCANDTAAAQGWQYFGTAQGNIKFDDEHPLSITNRNLLQVGIGANKQNRDLFGASGLVTFGNGRVGSINIVLNNPLSSACSMVCVNDTATPKILDCPQNMTQLVVRSPVAVSWAAPSVRDDCSSPTLTTTHLPNSLFAEGETRVVYTAQDVRGNRSTCSFKVVVNKVAAGSLCSTYDVDNTNDVCGCSANQWKPYGLRVGSNNCGEYFKTDSVVFHINGDSSAQLSGRFRSDLWQAVMVDVRFAKTTNQVPRFELCQNGVSEAASQWQYFGTMSGTIKFGNTSVAIQSSSLLQIGKGANGQNPNIVGGSVNFVLANGMQGSFNIILNNYQQFICPNYNPCAHDVTPPVLVNCPMNITVMTSQTSAPVIWTLPTVTDNCSTPSIYSNFSSGTDFPVGATTVVYTAQDGANNMSQCRFVVTVERVDPCIRDITPPMIINCPANISVNTPDNATRVPVSWTMPSIMDNCSTPSVQSNFPSGISFGLGNTIILITAYDASGNRSQCSFTITVNLLRVGVDDPNVAFSNIKIAPNPATSQIRIDLESLASDHARLEISNTLGQVVFKQNIDVKAGENHLPIDVSFLAKGVYYLTMRGTQFNTPKTIRFMKI